MMNITTSVIYFIYLPIYGLLNDAVSSSDYLYIALNDEMINE
jgi:hypothetical protein